MKKTYIKIGLLLFLLAIPLLSFAATSNLIAQIPLDPSLKPEYATNINVAGETNRVTLANAVLQMAAGGLIYLAGPLAILMMVIGGLRYIVSRGDQTQVEEAKKTITYSIIGLIVIILSWAIVTNVLWITMHGGTQGSDAASEASSTVSTPAQPGKTPGEGGTGGGTTPTTDQVPTE